MSLKPIQEGRFKSTVKKKTVKNLRLGLFRTGALSQVIRAPDMLRKKVKFCEIFGADLQKNWPISREIFVANFAKKQWVKNSQFHCNALGKFH